MTPKPRYDPFDEVRRHGEGRGAVETGTRPRFESRVDHLIKRRQEGLERTLRRSEVQPLWNEVLRVFLITFFILLDGVVFTMPLVALRPYGALARWGAFIPVLAGAVFVEALVYRRFWPDGWDELEDGNADAEPSEAVGAAGDDGEPS